MTQGRAGAAVRAALKGQEPSDEQWRAITHPLVPVHLIAGAGSGKTAVMAARIAWAIESQGYQPSHILGLTFTNKAAEELQDRVRSAVDTMSASAGVAGAEVSVQTYHAFAASIVREHGLLVGVEPDAGLLSEAQQWQMVLSCLDELPPFEAIELRSPAGMVRATLQLASSLADHIIGTADVEAAAERILSSTEPDETMRLTALRRRELCRAVEAYSMAKRRLQRIDFGDQVTKAVAILESNGSVARAYRERWPVVLLDEYQDTNVAQRRLVAALVGPEGAVTAVGDARQAIYAFRGATMYNLIGFPEHFPRSGRRHDHVSLSQNFRSGAHILEVANHVVGRIPPGRRPGDPLEALPANGDGRVELGLFADERAEALWIAARCEELHGEVLAPRRDPVRWRDVAILVRRRSSMDPILQALEDNDIPVEVVGLSGLLKTPEVVEVVAWLRCLDTRPSSNRWLARVLLGPRWRVHYRDLALCARWAAGRNRELRLRLAGGDEEMAADMTPGDVGFALHEALDHVDDIEGLGERARERLRSVARCLADLHAVAPGSLLDLVQEVVRRSGIGDALAASSSRSAIAARQNIANFMDYVAAFAPVEGEASLKSFLAYLDAAEDADETLEAAQPAVSDSVKLMTVHAAKGLEFECVFVPKVAASRNDKGDYVFSVFPDTRASNPLTNYTELPYEVREDAHHLPRWTGKLRDFQAEVKERVVEDERRLLYVALTRAKQRLAVTSAWWYGRDNRAKGPSLFFDELAELAASRFVEVVRRDEQPSANPVVADLESRRSWPPQPRAGLDDALFPEGWGEAADAIVAGRVAMPELAARLSAAERDQLERMLRRHAYEIDVLARARRPAQVPGVPAPTILSATEFSLLRMGDGAHARVRPLPERPSVDRHLGMEIHRLIEQRSLEADDEGHGMPAACPDERELDEPRPVQDRAWLRERLRRWEELGYARRKPARLPSGLPMVEVPFTALLDGAIVRGRVDAVFEGDDGGVEIVDYKSGRRFESGGFDQLEVYARALHANGLLPRRGRVILTYVFLDGGEPLRRPWKPPP